MRLTAVTPLSEHILRVTLDDGTSRDIDVAAYIARGPIFEPVRDRREMFEQVAIDPIDNTVTWPNGANIDTLVLLGIKEPAASPTAPPEVFCS